MVFIFLFQLEKLIINFSIVIIAFREIIKQIYSNNINSWLNIINIRKEYFKRMFWEIIIKLYKEVLNDKKINNSDK